MSSPQFIFVGFVLDDKLREGTSACKDSDKVFLTDSVYLETLNVNGDEIIGKRIESGAPQDRLDDTARSVASLLTRVFPDFDGRANPVNIFAIEQKDDSGGMI